MHNGLWFQILESALNHPPPPPIYTNLKTKHKKWDLLFVERLQEGFNEVAESLGHGRVACGSILWELVKEFLGMHPIPNQDHRLTQPYLLVVDDLQDTRGKFH